MSEARTIFKHSKVYALAAFLNRGVAFLTIPIYTNFLTQEEYGIFGVIAVTSEIVGAVIGLKLSTAMSRVYFDYSDQKERDEVVTTALLGAAGLTLLALAPLVWLAEPLARVALDREGLGELMFVGVAGLLLNTLFTFGLQYFLMWQRSRAFLVAGTARSLLYIALTAVMVMGLGMGIRGALLSLLLANAISVGGLAAPLLLRLGVRFSRRKFKDMVRFGAPLVPGHAADVAASFAERYLVVHLASLAASGVYYLALRLGMAINLAIVGPFNRIYLVRRFEAYGSGAEDREAVRVFTYFFVVVTFVALAVSMAAPEIVGLIAPGGYEGAVTVVPLICLAQVILALMLIAELSIYYAKISRHITTSSIVMLLAQVLFGLWLIPDLGILGAAIALVVATAVRLLAILWLGRDLPGPSPQWGTVGAVLAIAMVCFGLGRVASAGPAWLGVTGRAVLLAGFPVAVMASPLFLPEERRAFVRFLRRRTASEAPVDESGDGKAAFVDDYAQERDV